MKLTLLDAQFITNVKVESYSYTDTINNAQGVMFQCPKCAQGKEEGNEEGRHFYRGTHYIIVPFRDKGIPEGAFPKMARWEVSGTSLEDLTTKPSILLTGEGCQWHGFITNGDVHE